MCIGTVTKDCESDYRQANHFSFDVSVQVKTPKRRCCGDAGDHTSARTFVAFLAVADYHSDFCSLNDCVCPPESGQDCGSTYEHRDWDDS